MALLAGCGDPSLPAAGKSSQSSTARITPAPTFPVSSSASPGYPTDDPHRTAVLAAVQRTLAGVALPPGARWTTSAPGPYLNAAPSQPASPTVLDGVRWFVAPTSSPAAVLAYERAGQQRPPEMTSTGGSDEHPRTRSAAWGFPAPGASYSELAFTVVALERGSAVRVDALATWLPTRPVDAKVPTGLIGALLTYRPDGNTKAKPKSLELDEQNATRVADAVNSLPLLPPGEYSCAMDAGEQYIAVFRTPTGTVADAAVDLQGCYVVTLSVGGKSTGLSGSTALTNLLNSLLPAK
jgi:hypothetical protein